MAAAESINNTDLDNDLDTDLDSSIIEQHDSYVSDLLSKDNKWINILLSSTGLNAEILMLYKCLREPGQYNYKNFKKTVNLRDDNSVEVYMKEIITNINLIIEGAPRYDKDIVVWRGLNTSKLPKNDDTMLSTSIKYSVANSFSNSDNIHKIIIPAGMPFLYLEPHTKTEGEHECLLPFGCVFSDYRMVDGDEKTIAERTLLDVKDVDSLISSEFMNLLRTNKTEMDTIISQTLSEQEKRIQEKLARLSRRGKGKKTKKRTNTRKRIKRPSKKTKRQKRRV